MGLDTRSPETVYGSRNNIIVPKTDPRAVAVLDDTAAQHVELDTTDLPQLHTRSSGVITQTWSNTLTKET